MLDVNKNLIKQIILQLSLIGIIFLLSNQSFTQNPIAKSDIKGYVKDAKSGEALPFANIVLKGTNRGTTTTTDGYFVLVNVPVGICSSQVHYIGCESQMVSFENVPKGLPPFIITMKPTVIEVEGVTVTAQAEMLDASSKQVSQITFSPRQLSSLPSIGEVDVFRTMQLLPGISGANEGESGLYIR